MKIKAGWLEQNQKWLESNYLCVNENNYYGAVAKRLGSGLQNHLERFNSAPHLHFLLKLQVNLEFVGG